MVEETEKLISLLIKAVAEVNIAVRLYEQAHNEAQMMAKEIEREQPTGMEFDPGFAARDILSTVDEVMGVSVGLNSYLRHCLNEDHCKELSRAAGEIEETQHELRKLMHSLRPQLQAEVDGEAEKAERKAAEEARQAEQEAAEAEARRAAVEEGRKLEREKQQRREDALREQRKQVLEGAILRKLKELGERAWQRTPSYWGLGRVDYWFNATLDRLVEEGKIYRHRESDRHVWRYSLTPWEGGT